MQGVGCTGAWLAVHSAHCAIEEIGLLGVKFPNLRGVKGNDNYIREHMLVLCSGIMHTQTFHLSILSAGSYRANPTRWERWGVWG